MGIADKAKDLASGHEKQSDQVIDKAGDAVDSKTGDKHSSQVDQVQKKADDAV